MAGLGKCKDNFERWFADLGFYKGQKQPFREYQTLLDAVQSFFEEFEKRGIKIPPNSKAANNLEARQCSSCFLRENNEARAYQFFGINVLGGPQGWRVWPADQDRITEVLSNIFRLRAFYSYQTRLKRDKELNQTAPPANQKRSRKRPRAGSMNSTNSETRNARLELLRLDNGLFSIDKKYSLKTWNAPPNRLNVKALLEYIQDLWDSKNDETNLKELSRVWLSSSNPSWPKFAGKRLQIYMHRYNLYFGEGLHNDIPVGLAHYLRRGTELMHMIPAEWSLFHAAVRARIQLYSQQFLDLCYLEYDDENIQKTGRFEQLWDEVFRKEEFQEEDGQNLPKRRRRQINTMEPAEIESPQLSPEILRTPIEAEMDSMNGSQGRRISVSETEYHLETQATSRNRSSSSCTSITVAVPTPTDQKTSSPSATTENDSRLLGPLFESRMEMVCAPDIKAPASPGVSSQSGAVETTFPATYHQKSDVIDLCTPEGTPFTARMSLPHDYTENAVALENSRSGIKDSGSNVIRPSVEQFASHDMDQSPSASRSSYQQVPCSMRQHGPIKSAVPTAFKSFLSHYGTPMKLSGRKIGPTVYPRVSSTSNQKKGNSQSLPTPSQSPPLSTPFIPEYNDANGVVVQNREFQNGSISQRPGKIFSLIHSTDSLPTPPQAFYKNLQTSIKDGQEINSIPEPGIKVDARSRIVKLRIPSLFRHSEPSSEDRLNRLSLPISDSKTASEKRYSPYTAINDSIGQHEISNIARNPSEEPVTGSA
ncbi:hypothetical protein G7Y89_g5617 [Cudoniella acicularis]|uniref:Uncharacterized protein n=1 Tax=Cudoniella acicularis TaxID=354080 RepID=A0A8H4W5J6_9HELO|nr:hypothetical protein G7Y89_g5617 [Cudoniella acicularis]